MCKRCLLGVCSVLLTLPGSASGQVSVESAMKLVLTVVGGITAPTGMYSDEWKHSASYGFEADLSLDPQWIILGIVSYSSAEARFTTVTDKAKILELGANVKYVVSSTPLVKPHIRFGAALYNRDLGSSTTENDFGVNGGGGVDFYLAGSPIGFSATARFHKIFITSTSTQTGDWEFFSLWGGLRVKLL